jgi:hypothetical protein
MHCTFAIHVESSEDPNRSSLVSQIVVARASGMAVIERYDDGFGSLAFPLAVALV